MQKWMLQMREEEIEKNKHKIEKCVPLVKEYYKPNIDYSKNERLLSGKSVCLYGR